MEGAHRFKIGITIGDPSGIGAVITVKALKRIAHLAQFVVIGDSGVLEKAGLDSSVRRQMRLIDLANVPKKDFQFGRVKGEYARAGLEYLEEALTLIQKRKIQALVTCPMSKEAVNLAGIRFSGHSEYFCQRLKIKNVTMMLLNRWLKFALVTRHIALKDVSVYLNKDLIIRTLIDADHASKRLFGIIRPRLVVCALNPHASDNGLFGDEEERIIKPALAALKRKFRYLQGPLPADLAIAAAAQNKYDVVIALYHDQALIPLKLSDPESGVNLTLGLPFIRTSPLHGTAFDVAGQQRLANPRSLIAAIELSVRCLDSQRRKAQ